MSRVWNKKSDMLNTASNNSSNRSGMSAALIANLPHDVVVSRPVNSGVMLPARS